MNLPDEAPKPNPWPFIVGDIVLFAVALLIAIESPAPLSVTTLFAIVVCVGLGAVLACIPIVLSYTRRQDALLAERQEQLVSLTQAAAAAASQLSIATNSLHNFAESSARMVKHAELLPARLQEKIAEFKTQLNEVAIAENEALEQEVNTLRASETERLETALATIKETALEIAALEHASQQRAAGIRDAFTRHAADSAASAKKHSDLIAAQAAALDSARADTEKKIAAAHAAAQTALAASLEKNADGAIARLEARFAGLLLELDAHMRKQEQQLGAALASSAGSAAAAIAAATAATAAVETPPAASALIAPGKEKIEKEKPAKKKMPSPHEHSGPAAPAQETQPPPAPVAFEPRPEVGTKPAAEPEANAPAPAPLEPAAPQESEDASEISKPAADESDNAHQAKEKSASRNTGNAENFKSEIPPQSAPPPPAPPAPEASAQPPPPASGPASPQPSPSEHAAPPPPHPPRRRPAPKSRPPKDEEPTLGLDLPPPSDEYAQHSPEENDFSSAVSADGLTRLIATAYIGIGNKLYIRGEGPGLSWEKGVPLQFVSIGKWRWETADASGPVAFKLYKNDTQECTAIGTLQLQPGHQHEVTANF